MKQKTGPKNYQFQTEIGSLLDLLANSLYSNKEIFLRELISNAVDALAKVKFDSLTDNSLLDKDEELKIDIKVDEKEKSFSITDNGVGMTKQELVDNLGTIAKSGTMAFLKNLGDQKEKNLDLIGKFGVGFYSVFMVATEVSVETASSQDKNEFAHRWVSNGEGVFTIEKIEPRARGTKISFKFKKNTHDLASKWRIEEVIKQYSNFTPFKIEVNGEQINRQNALWTKNKSQIKEDEYNELFKYLSGTAEKPRFTYHYNSDAPLQFNVIMFIPQKGNNALFQNQRDSQLHLYCKKVFIQDDCKDILPAWLRFVHGVVDSHDLPLNVSRQTLQNNPILSKIQNFLIKKILGEWETLKRTNKEAFQEFWQNFGVFVKEGIYSDFGRREMLLKLYHSYTSKNKDEIVSLQEYVDRMGPEQKEIYYIHGKSRSQVEVSPNLEYFKQNKIEVLYLYEEVDEFVISSIGTFADKAIVSVDKAEIQEPKSDSKKVDDKKEDTSTDSPSELQFTKLKENFKHVLGDKISDVHSSKRLVDSPCTLVSHKDAPTFGMEKALKMMNKDFSEAKNILEVNFKHPIIKNMIKIQKRLPQDAIIKETIELLFDNCLIIKRNLELDSLIFSKINKMLHKTTSIYLKSLD
ncbi:MAG: molecular chaperone HtpG [SAR324 cluster bacterium]|nr:molecular chaperone HtpG [SAR324 cluster bacterium]